VTGGRFKGKVKIVGAGLIGTSIGLALSKQGVSVYLEDLSPATQRLASEYGAGEEFFEGVNPDLVIVCVPPEVTARLVKAELQRHIQATVIDVSSVKSPILDELAAEGADLTRYLGTHPMAGRERGGAVSGRADIFIGRPWVIAINSECSVERVNDVEAMILDLGAQPIRMSAKEHDRAVALVSHVPQVVSSLLAARLVGASGVELAGQGLRDTTRIAASDPKLWVQILGANASEVEQVLVSFRDDLDTVIDALGNISGQGSLMALDRLIGNGNRGVEQLPGKHGSRKSDYQTFIVMIDDRPGELARLFAEVGEIGINIEDMKLEHSPGAQIGLVELSIAPKSADRLQAELLERGWRFAG